ncbi:hypothetical protein T06_5326 [Trichinella sp. T6]|nr:hypothetical protein T06_5326 [Trichinella sp. T6]
MKLQFTFVNIIRSKHNNPKTKMLEKRKTRSFMKGSSDFNY